MSVNTIVKNELENILISKNNTVLDCFRMLNKTGHHVLICLDQDEFVGIVTDHDIRQGILNGVKLEDRIESVINHNPIVILPEISKEAALVLMKEKKIEALPVVDYSRKFVKLYTLSGLLNAIVLPNSAVIMAGGFGKRLMPLTKNTPKPLLKIGGKPIIEHTIKQISDYGIESFFITINFKSEVVKDYLKDGKQLGINIKYLEEEKQLGTIGAISLLRDKNIGFPFIVMNGDILTRVNHRKLLDFHKKSGNLLTVCLANYQYNVPYGVMEVVNENIIGINEKPIYSFYINAGIYCMSPELIDFIPQDECYDINMLINQLRSKKIPVGSFVIDEYWKDIGNPEDYFAANQDYNNGNLD